MKQWSLIFTLFVLSIASACEKEELIVVDDGRQFCPIRFNTWGWNQGPSDCFGLEPMPASLIKPSEPGVIIEQTLAQEYTPFIVAYHPDSSIFRAIHTSSSQSQHRVVFDKIDMPPGARVSLFLGATVCLPPYNFCFLGGFYNDKVLLGPSELNAWQIFVQREEDGTYSFGYMADSVQTIAADGILDFKTCSMEMVNKGEKSVFYGGLTPEGATAPVWVINTEAQHIPAFPDNLYVALGFDLLPPFSTDCEKHLVKINWKTYEYKNVNSPHNLLESFDCLSIVKI